MVFAGERCAPVWGLVLYARAGRERDLNSLVASPSHRVFLNGLLLCIFTGCFGSMINMGFLFGGKDRGSGNASWCSCGAATLCVWAVVLAAGYLPNAIYTLYLLKTESQRQRIPKMLFAGNAVGFRRGYPLALRNAWIRSRRGRDGYLWKLHWIRSLHGGSIAVVERAWSFRRGVAHCTASCAVAHAPCRGVHHRIDVGLRFW